MIKLNNKNITYVALADSNNSVKGVKEIWYADSANSVKLVYRRKDALIEGEDYEKYHWLVGDADAYINTLKYYRPYDDSVQMTFRDNLYPNREGKYNKYNAEEQIWGACMYGTGLVVRSYISGYDSTNKICNNVINSSTTDSGVNWGAYAVRSFINESPEHSLYVSSVDANTDKYYFIYNGDTKNNLSTRYTLPEIINQDVCVFQSNRVSNGYFNGSFFNFIHYRNNVEITHLIPCKLLKPVPKWLDANGIRRQVGECGMIDLVSGKFYGNVNSVGTFTVENYYERKEWLVAEISRVNTLMSLPIYSNKVQYTRVFVKFANIGYFLTTNNISYINISGVNIIYNNSTHTATSCGNSSLLSYIEVVCDSDSIVIDGELLENNLPVEKIQFYNASTTVDANFLTSKVTVDNKERYIPCTLTMDLPASMDANNIARTKGTSGMWDLVSDRFYGNVANSGTFKAVNLAEGVDYEVHQWLKGDGTTYIDTNIIVNSSTLVLSIKSKASSSTTNGALCGSRNGAAANSDTTAIHYQSGRYRLDLLSVSNEYVWVNKSNLEDTFDIDLASNTAVVNGTSFTSSKNHTNSINTFRVFGCFGANVGYSGCINKFMLNDSYSNLNLVPIKLLHSIPAKYDANGIARNAGECGMYDTVNDVFYGNVANSGSFTVEDDN